MKRNFQNVSSILNIESQFLDTIKQVFMGFIELIVKIE